MRESLAIIRVKMHRRMKGPGAWNDHRSPLARDTTKGGAAAVLPLPTALRPWIEYQLAHAPGHLVFPAPDGSQRTREADPQKILRNALSRAGIAEGWEHRCRWCGHKERHQDREQRYCPTCLKRTDGTGKPAKHVRGRLLWPKALPLKMRFHDLRHYPDRRIIPHRHTACASPPSVRGFWRMLDAG